VNRSQESIFTALQAVLRYADASVKVEAVPEDDAPELAVALSQGSLLLVGYYPALTPHRVPGIRAYLGARATGGQRPALCVRRLGWSLLEKCRALDLPVFDLEGNAWFPLPGLYIERIRPSRLSSPMGSSATVFTAKATRLVRAMLSRFPASWRQTDLVDATGLSAGYVSTLAKRLVAQGYLRKRSGRLTLEDPDRLLDDWVAHYRFDRHGRRSFAVSAGSYDDGLQKLGTALGDSGVEFAWCGWSGAHLRAPFATPPLYTAYAASEPKEMAGVFPVEGEGNVVLYLPQDAGVFQFSNATDAGPVVSDVQLYIDLVRMPGRAKEQADALRFARLDFERRG